MSATLTCSPYNDIHTHIHIHTHAHTHTNTHTHSLSHTHIHTHQQVHHWPQVASIPEIRPRCKGLTCSKICGEGAGIHLQRHKVLCGAISMGVCECKGGRAYKGVRGKVCFEGSRHITLSVLKAQLRTCTDIMYWDTHTDRHTHSHTHRHKHTDTHTYTHTHTNTRTHTNTTHHSDHGVQVQAVQQRVAFTLGFVESVSDAGGLCYSTVFEHNPESLE